MRQRSRIDQDYGRDDDGDADDMPRKGMSKAKVKKAQKKSNKKPSKKAMPKAMKSKRSKKSKEPACQE